jgi:predicted esterase
MFDDAVCSRSMRRFAVRAAAVAVALLSFASERGRSHSAFAQEAAGEAAPQRASAAVAREDLALSYLLLERALDASAPLADDRRADLNRKIDALTFAFFAGRMTDAITALHTATATVVVPNDEDADARAVWTALAAHRLAMPERFILRPTDADELGSIRVAWRRVVPAAPPPEGTMVLVIGPDGSTISQPFQGASDVENAGSSSQDLRLCSSRKPAYGRYAVALRAPGLDAVVEVGELFVLRERPSATKARLGARFEAIARDPRVHPNDAASTKARLDLLVDAPSRSSSSQFLADPWALAGSLDEEIQALEAGRSPWVGRTGDAWRRIDVLGVQVPFRQFLPPATEGQSGAVPLVVALHGAGGDESMFFTGYGNGLLLRLARERGFAVVSPFTTVVAGSPLVFDALVDELVRCASAERPIDRSKVVVLGHSMGAAATWSLAGSRSTAIARTAMIAGGFRGLPEREGDAKDLADRPPVLLVLGALDPMAPADRVLSDDAAARLRERGLRLDLDRRRHEGHTLLVTAVLPSVIDWLLR